MFTRQITLTLIASFLFIHIPYTSNAEEAGASLSNGMQQDISANEITRKVEQTIDALYGKSNDWQEPSLKSEHIYIGALRRWLGSLQPFQQERARKILREAQPAMSGLRKAIRDKKSELAELSFDRNTAPETLPRLGMELQELRATLQHKLQVLSNRLYFEAGVKLGPIDDNGFWLMPSSKIPVPLSGKTRKSGRVS